VFPAVVSNACWVVQPVRIVCALIGASFLGSVTLLAVASDPKKPPALASPSDLERGDALLQQARLLKQQQFTVATQLTKDFPDDFDAWRVLGFVHSSHGNLNEMFKCWQQCLKLSPKRADIYDQLGRFAAKTEKYEDAIRYWQKALQISSKTPGIRLRMGYALLNLGKVDQAVAALQREVELAPNSSQAHYLLGQSLFQRHDYIQAKIHYETALRLQPKHTHACYGLVKASTRLGQKQLAATYSKKFRQLTAANAEWNQDLRSQYDDLGRIRQKLAVTCSDAGRVYYWHKKTSQAESLWIRAATIDSHNTACRGLLGSLYGRQGKTPKALDQYKQLAGIEPRRVAHYQQIGWLQARLGNLAAAASAFNKIRQIAPHQAAGHRMLALLYLNTNQQLPLAQKLAATAVKLEPNAASYFALGWAYAKNGNRADALSALQKATRLDPKNATYRQFYESLQKQP
jgi:tetratricopeptide (TPR) repeat protein